MNNVSRFESRQGLVLTLAPIIRTSLSAIRIAEQCLAIVDLQRDAATFQLATDQAGPRELTSCQSGLISTFTSDHGRTPARIDLKASKQTM